jgi:RHS repeat-associated protein
MTKQIKSLSLRLPSWSATVLLTLQVMLPAQAQSPAAPAPCPANTSCAPAPAAPACNPQLQCCAAPPGSGTPACGAAAGNPLNTLTGNKFQTEVDMPALPGVLGLELVRYYNSELAGIQGGRGALGRGWRLSYDAQLVVSPDAKVITHIAPDGTYTRYQQAPPPQGLPPGSTLYRNGQDQLLAKPGRGGYALTQANKTQYSFNTAGKLSQILAPTGHAVNLERNTSGQLLKVTDPQGRSLTFSYLDEAQAQAGDRYRGVQHIDTPVGRYSYHYGSTVPAGMSGEIDKVNLLANLVKVDLASAASAKADPVTSPTISPATSRHYHYEDPRWPTLLTGISLHGTGTDQQAMAQRLVTWAYDAQGRAVLSVKGQPARLAMKPGPDGKPSNTPLEPKRLQEGTGIEQVTLQFKEHKADGTGLTVLTNSLGQDTLYTYQTINGQKTLSEVRGPGCATCGPSNQRYTYNAQGQITRQSQLDAKGQVIQSVLTDYDSAGRAVQISRQRVIDGRDQAPQWQVRYQYANNNANALSQQPSRISRPSVVPGQEHHISVSYNLLGQITQQTETGFSPLDDKGQVAATPAQASKIERTTQYTYSLINDRSVLTEIDGPLPNGPQGSPQDSDITRYEWDEKAQFMRRVIRPGGHTHTIAYDTAGRPNQTTWDDGYRQIQTHTQYAQQGSIATQPQRTARTAYLVSQGSIQPDSKMQQIVLQAQFDAMGRITQSTDKAGRVIHHQYDSAGRALGIADAQGYKSQLSLDTEGRTQVAGLYLPGQTQPHRAVYNWHDEQGRLTQRLLPDGRLDAYAYDSADQLVQHQQSHGPGADILHTYRQNAAQTVQAHIAQSADGWLRVDLRAGRASQIKPQAMNFVDDLGRVVRQALPDHGTKTAQHDAAGRITYIESADGSRQTYQYDSAARLIARAYESPLRPSQEPPQTLARLAYQGHLLISTSDPAQTSQYHYDALGRKTGEDISLTALAGATPQRHLHIATRYDSETGLIQARVLADGRTLRTLRSSAQTGATALRLTLQAPWAAWLQDKTEQVLPHSLSSLLIKALPGQVVAQDINVHPFNGLTSYTAGNGLATTKSHDIAGRMTELKTDKISTLNYTYAVGPRIQAIKQQPSPAPASGPLLTANYQYKSFGGLQETQETSNVLEKPTAMKVGAAPAINSWSRGLMGTQTTSADPTARYDPLGRTQQDAKHRYSYTSGGQVQAVTDIASNQLIAQYTYNSQNQRVRKTVMAQGQARITHYLWQANCLVAELDERGHITSQYLYLNEGQVATPIAKLESGDNTDNSQSQERILFIHTDHRATPVAMTNDQQKIVWQAELTPSGVMKTDLNVSPKANERTTGPSGQAVLNIRLPGQYFDAETGLHDNLHRTYNPKTGRYLQPDPLGYPDGPDAYLYAQGDAVNKMDPLGLYAENVHYYMTYFLARLAGIETQEALTIALAAQYIDDNDFTRPLNVDVTGLGAEHRIRLATYHFTQNGFDPARTRYVPTNEDRVAAIRSGNPPLPPYIDESDAQYIPRRVLDPSNPQLGNLLSASNRAPTRCSKAQLFGEYLHTFQDTFAHRDPNNDPISIDIGTGHLIYGHSPDETYNHFGGVRFWNVNEARTYQMEKAVLARLTAYSGRGFVNSVTGTAIINSATGRAVTYADLFGTGQGSNSWMDRWNAMTNESDQIFAIDDMLQQLGLGGISTYSRSDACQRRTRNLQGLNQANYAGTILATQGC